MNSSQLKPTAESNAIPAAFDVEASCLTDRGRVRPINEDTGCAVVPDDAALRSRKGALLVVADGMGGHQGGSLASSLAVETVLGHYYADSAQPAQALPAAVQAANRAVLEHARTQANLAGMGTTCTAVAVVEGLAWVAYVGDTRLYLVRGGGAYRMTQEHSATMEMVKRGLLTLREADRHEERNVILRAVGTRERLEVSTWEEAFPLRAGDSLVVCSDGMYAGIADQEIADICARCRAAADACAEFVQVALERDGSDNITVAVLRVLAPGGEVRS